MNRRMFVQQTVALALMETLSPFTKGATLAANYLADLDDAQTDDRVWKLYSMNGQVLFSIYTAGGSLSTKQVCYLIRPKELKKGRVVQYSVDGGDLGRGTGSLWGWEALAIGFNDLEFYAVGDNEEAVRQLVKAKLERATAMGKPVIVDLNGGSLPLPEED